MHPIQLSLYVHIPWCVRKCPYCDFNSHPLEGGMDEAAYVEALLKDLALEAPWADGRRLESIFFGGGTPSLFSAQSIGRILEASDRLIGLSTDCEITLEANPGTVEARRFDGYRATGVNRLSIGAQSFNNTALKKLGRVHDADEAIAAVRMAQAAGIPNINIDLMYALPDQELPAAHADLEQAIALQPAHISYYQLTLEPGTHFHRHPPRLPDHERAWSMQQQGETLLASAGYGQYEVSAYAQHGSQCRHNLNYWHYGDYLGIGAGAHGKVTRGNSIWRRSRTRLPKHYLARAGEASVVADMEEVSPADSLFEFLLNALRLKEGIALQDFARHTGQRSAELLQALRPMQEQQLIQVTAHRVCCTALGWRHLDGLLTSLLPEAA